MSKYTLQLLLNQEFNGVVKRHNFPLYQYKALKQLSQCRTHVLGGHAQYCEEGHLNGVWYNSCKNRSCPQCRGLASEEWLANTQRVLLDCPHHHVIFTLPSELNVLWRYNRDLFTDVLFKSVSETLKLFAEDKRYLHATPGILSTLHTWGRNLSLHPHLHVLISHGGVDKQGHWVEPKKKHLFPRKPIMMVYRGKLLQKLKEALKHNKLILPDDTQTNQCQTLLNKLGRKEWVVHFCKRYNHGAGVATYLARYVKGGPLNNGQLDYADNSRVVFQYKSHETKQIEKLQLSLDAFILRWVQHIPLPGKPSVRYSGLYCSSLRIRLNQARSHFKQSPVSARAQLDWQEYMKDLGHMPQCTVCGKSLNQRGPIEENLKVA